MSDDGHSGKIDYPELEWRWAIVLGSALETGLIEAVADGPKPAATVASELSLDGRATYTVLSALAELGILDESEAGYSLLEEHRGPLLDTTRRDYVGGRVVHRYELIGKWSRMADILKTGEPSEDRTIPEFEGTATMARAMRGGAQESADQISKVILSRLPDEPEILDVGGGPGANAESLARHGARVTVFDRPEVLEVTAESLAAAGVKTIAGDMRETLPEGLFDAIYFGNTSHMYGSEANRDLYARMRQSLKPGGRLFIREFVRGHSPDAALFAVTMLVITPEGQTYTLGEYEEWITAAGYEDVELIELPGRTTYLVTAVAR